MHLNIAFNCTTHNAFKNSIVLSQYSNTKGDKFSLINVILSNSGISTRIVNVKVKA